MQKTKHWTSGVIAVTLLSLLLSWPLGSARSQPLQKEWSLKVGGMYDEAAFMTPLRDGGYAVVTHNDTTGLGPGGQTVILGYSLGITILNSNGSIRERFKYEDLVGIGEITCVTELPDGDIVVGGFTSADREHDGLFDAWAACFDTEGNMLWHRGLGGSAKDYFFSVCAADSGGCILTGQTQSNDGDILDSHGGSSTSDPFPFDGWVVKLNGKGQIVWSRSIGGTGEDYLDFVVHSSDGGYLLAGMTASHDGDITTPLKGTDDMLLLKIDSHGRTEWSNTYGGSSGQNAIAAIQLADGSYVVLGETSSNDGDAVGYESSVVRPWLLKVDSLGTLKWERCLLRPTFPTIRAIAETKDNGLILAGEFDSGKVVPFPVDFHGPQSAVSVSLTADGQSASLTYSSPHGGPVSLDAVDILGRTLWERPSRIEQPGEHTELLSLSHFASGPVWIRLHTAQSESQSKIIVGK